MAKKKTVGTKAARAITQIENIFQRGAVMKDHFQKAIARLPNTKALLVVLLEDDGSIRFHRYGNCEETSLMAMYAVDHAQKLLLAGRTETKL